MTTKNLLNQFEEKKTIESYLYKNTSNQDKVKLLQLCLNDLGFGEELKFAKFGADGFYGESCIRAVKAFAAQNGFESNGEKITNDMLKKIVALKETNTSKALQTFLAQVETADTIAVYLSRGSKYKNEIVALQVALYNIGYGKALNWEKFGADGGYGQSTVDGILAFANKNGFVTDGEVVTLELFQKITELDEVVTYLRTLHKTIDNNQPIQQGSDKSVVRALQYMLHFLGYDTELNWEKFGADGQFGASCVAAVKAYAAKEKLTFENEIVTIELLQKIISHYESSLGEDWKTAQSSTSFESLTVREIDSRTYEVSDGFSTNQFKKVSLQGFTGMRTDGSRTVKSFLQGQNELLEKLNISDSSLNVIQAVEVNEGKLDGINSYDSAYFSFGIFQWTIGQKDAEGELPALLKKIKQGAPQVFHQYFGNYGLDVSDSQTGTTYGYLTLNSQLVKTTTQKTAFRDPRWAFIFWKAAQDPVIQAFEIEHAIARFKNFYWVKNQKYLNGHTIAEYITSEYGVALLIDQNVNRPNDVFVYTRKALDATGLKNPENWTTTEERQLINKYIELRNDSAMWDPKNRAARTTEFVKKGIISDERNSFEFEKFKARGLEMYDNQAASFNQEDYPELTEVKEQHY